MHFFYIPIRVPVKKMQAEGCVVTRAGSLRCKHVIHIDAQSSHSWKSKIKKCLEAANNLELSSVTFPAVGTGNFICIYSIYQPLDMFILSDKVAICVRHVYFQIVKLGTGLLNIETILTSLEHDRLKSRQIVHLVHISISFFSSPICSTGKACVILGISIQ